MKPNILKSKSSFMFYENITKEIISINEKMSDIKLRFDIYFYSINPIRKILINVINKTSLINS